MSPVSDFLEKFLNHLVFFISSGYVKVASHSNDRSVRSE